MRVFLAGLCCLAATPAMAGSLDVSASVGIVSDYRFRGFSQTMGRAAVQGDVTVTHDSGLTGGIWASTTDIAATDRTGAPRSIDAEIDLFAGYSRALTPSIALDAGLFYYAYPGGGVAGATDYVEPYATITTTRGPVTIGIGANYAWGQAALGGASAIYVHAEPSIGFADGLLALNGHAGYARSGSTLGGYGRDGALFDWSAGGSLCRRALTLAVTWVDTDERRHRANGTGARAVGASGGVVVSLAATF